MLQPFPGVSVAMVMETEILTNISKIMAYKAYYPAAYAAMVPRMEKARSDAQQSKEAIFREVVWYHDEQTFVCAIHANAVQARVNIYQMLDTPASFEAIAYDTTNGMYYFFIEHFFEQYASRMGIAKKSPLGILHHYVRQNPAVAFMNVNPCQPQGEGFTAWLEAGVAFGGIKAANVRSFITFVTHGMLMRKQRKKLSKLRRKYMEVKRRPFSRIAVPLRIRTA